MKSVIKFSIAILTLQMGLFTSLVSGQFIKIKEGTSVQIDGHMDSMEWADADSVLINLNASSMVTVKFKHDGTNFNFAFLNNLESFNIRFPEILLDIGNDKSANWLTDDWWFHVSATDCESNTAANDYSNCLTIQPGWTAVNNFSSGPPMTDTVEIQIPFYKVNFVSTATDTIGLAFDVTNTFSAWNFWPGIVVNALNPSTWGSAIVEFNTTDITRIHENPFTIISFPNPVKDNINIIFAGKDHSCSIIQLRDIQGKLLHVFPFDQIKADEIISLSLEKFNPGYYTLEYIDENYHQTIKVIKF